MKKKRRAQYAAVDHKEEIKRLNRLIGQVEGVRRMLEDKRKLEDVLAQCKAIHSVLRSIESRIVSAHIEFALSEITKIDKKKGREEKIAELEELFKQAS